MSLNFYDVLRIVNGKIVCVTEKERCDFPSKEAIIQKNLYENYVTTSISIENEVIVFEIVPAQESSSAADWVKAYKEQNGIEPSFF